jgi:hypothetical protein
MRITITKIDKSNPRYEIDSVGSIGYSVMVHCDLVEGSAILISLQNIKVGDSISVETRQEAISNLKVTSSTSLPLMKQLQNAGDYEITGVVSFESGDGIFYVDVDQFSFVLRDDDTKGAVLEKGQYVSFVLHGLIIYDEYV